MTSSAGEPAPVLWTATRANAMSAPEIAEFLRHPHVARLATIRADGLPHVTPVWYAFEAGRFYITLGERRRHLRNLARDPRATLLVDVDRRPDDGQDGAVKAVVASGPVDLHDDPATVARYAELIDARYLPPAVNDGEDPPLMAERYVLVVLEPSELLSWDFSK